MEKVVLQGGREPRFPQRCVRCLQAPAVTRSFRLEESLKARDGFDSEYPVAVEIAGVPYCAEHGREFDALVHRKRVIAKQARLVGLALAAGAALALHSLTSQWTYVVLGAMAAYVLAEAVARVGLGGSVSALGVDGNLEAELEKDPQSGKTRPIVKAIVLRFPNADYARLFAEANAEVEAGALPVGNAGP